MQTFVLQIDHYVVQDGLELNVISLSVVLHCALSPSFERGQRRTQDIDQIVVFRWKFIREYAHIRILAIVDIFFNCSKQALEIKYRKYITFLVFHWTLLYLDGHHELEYLRAAVVAVLTSVILKLSIETRTILIY